MKRFILLVALFAVAVLPMIAGCGGEKKATTPDANKPAGETKEAPKTEEKK